MLGSSTESCAEAAGGGGMGDMSGGTLVVCPMSLIAQWEEHVRTIS
jgi:hypothetical protein